MTLILFILQLKESKWESRALSYVFMQHKTNSRCQHIYFLRDLQYNLFNQVTLYEGPKKKK
jgi:hypothetical protein